MPRYKLLIEYDGTGLAGWQHMPGKPSVQGALMQAVFGFCGERVEVIGAGRTDAGVHALGQVAHLDLAREHSPHTVMSALNHHLQMLEPARMNTPLERRISILRAERVEDAFNARFSATARHYLFRILNRRAPPALEAGRVWHVPEKLDASAMHLAAQTLVGHHDFTSFRDTQCQANSPVKTLERLDVMRAGEEIHLHVSARSFLHHMVRNLAGTLKLAGTGALTPQGMARIRDAKDRREAGPTAPPHGLCLVRVDY